MAFIEPMHRNKPNITYLLTANWWCLGSTCCAIYCALGFGKQLRLIFSKWGTSDIKYIWSSKLTGCFHQCVILNLCGTQHFGMKFPFTVNEAASNCLLGDVTQWCSWVIDACSVFEASSSKDAASTLYILVILSLRVLAHAGEYAGFSTLRSLWNSDWSMILIRCNPSTTNSATAFVIIAWRDWDKGWCLTNIKVTVGWVLRWVVDSDSPCAYLRWAVMFVVCPKQRDI